MELIVCRLWFFSRRYMHPQTNPSASPSISSFTAFISFSLPLQVGQTRRLTRLFLVISFCLIPHTKQWLKESSMG
jgi:hypothetical protein